MIDMEPTQLENIILALLFASEEPVSTKKLSGIIDDVSSEEIKDAIPRLEERIARDYPSIVMERVAGGLQLATNPVYAEYIARLYSGRRKQRLSRAGMETLAIISYKQPITRADVEAIRGVGCGGVITTLMERSLIHIVGKAKVLGAPFLYGTTPEFLEYLGLNSLRDLPSMDEFEAMLEREESERGQEENTQAEGTETMEQVERDRAEAPAGPDAAAVVEPFPDATRQRTDGHAGWDEGEAEEDSIGTDGKD